VKGQNHIIRSILFDTAIANEELIDQWRNTVDSINMESIFGKALQRFDDKKEWTCIEKLEIDLGEMSRANEEEWNYKIIMAVEEQLSKTIRLIPANFSSSGLISTSYEEELSNVAVIDDESYRLQSLMNYLKTGISPWQLLKSEDIAEVLMDLIQKNPALVEYELRRVLQASDSAVERLMMVLEYEELIRITKLFVDSQIIDDLMVLFASVKKLNPLIGGKAIRQNMIRKLLACAVADDFTIEKLVGGIYSDELLALFNTGQLEKVQALIHEQIGHNTELVSILVSVIEKRAKEKEKKEAIRHSEIKAEIAKEIDETQIRTESKRKQDKPTEDLETLEEVIFIHNSGLVLLNPGLIKYYFEKLTWIQNNDFRSELTRKKAILWLHYLTHGDHKIREYELSLVKVLCGLLPHEIADVKLRLTKKERKEADEMLETVIENWTALKKVSNEGLRQSFLQREGRLTQDEAGWQLHVESKAYDILIDQLPWSYSIIKFPWMIKPLFTQWSTRI
jgi:hypothetical protein